MKKGKPLQAAHVSIGAGHCVALHDSKTVPYTWGDNKFGQLGLSCKKCNNHNDSFNTPMPVCKLKKLIEGQEASNMQF